jgi:O-succinylbenzoic acid--CoA ligase
VSAALDLLLQRAAEHPRAPAVLQGAESRSWEELLAEAEAFATRLQAAGVGPGQRVAVDVGLATTAAVRLLGCWLAEAVAVPLDPHLPQPERQRRLVEGGAAAVATSEGLTRRDGPRGDGGAGLVVFTSGTTGRSRGARLDFEALLASARGVVATTDLQAGDRWLSPLPLAHVGGAGVLVRCLLTGATASVMDRFEPQATAALLRHGTTHASLVGRMLDRLLDGEPFPDTLHLVMVGGGPVPPPLLARARAAGIPAAATYGLTEAGSTVTLQDPAEEPSPGGDAGRLLAGRRVRIGVGGVVEVSGPTMMRGYDGEPPLEPGAWFATGDLGEFTTDGRLRILDRRVDLIVSGGENVYPAEVEGVLGAHPAVDEVGLVGVADPSWGQRVVAIVRWSGVPDPATVEGFARRELAPPQRPRQWVTATEPLPRNRLGKLDRVALRALLHP